MADVVLGFGSSHAPQLRLPASDWPLMLQKDTNDPRFDYDEVLKRAKPDMDEELTPEVMKLRDESNHRAMGILRRKLEEASPDAIVVIGDDQHEQYLEDNMPMFSIFRGDSLPVRQRRARDPKLSAAWKNTTWGNNQKHVPDAHHPAAPELAEHLVHELVESGFDLSTSNELRHDVGVGHAFSFLYNEIMPEADIPVVPVMVNTFYPPNQPTPKRCIEIGEALRDGIESWAGGKKVAVMASGGMSHFIIDEELAHEVLDAMQRKDNQALAALPRDRMMILGTTEILNWITVSGAMRNEKMSLVDYVPCYRTPAGTGCAMGFAYWE